jgi:hypothetical protein
MKATSLGLAYHAHRNALGKFRIYFGENEPSRFAKSSMLKLARETAPLCFLRCRPCMFYLAGKGTTCHTPFVQTASHTETEGCFFARSNALSEIDAYFCRRASWTNKCSIFQYFMWTGKDVGSAGQPP